MQHHHVKKKPMTRPVEVAVRAGDLYVIVAKPATGKSEVAAVLEKEGGILHKVCSDTVNRSAEKDAELAQKLAKISEKGELWPDEIVDPVMLTDIAKNSGLPLALDGYSRTVGQSKRLMGYARARKVKVRIIHIDAPDRLTIERVANRTLERKQKGLPPRNDDAVHAVRLAEYHKYAPPLLEFFRAQSDVEFHEIDGTQSKEDVRNQVRSKVLMPVSV